MLQSTADGSQSSASKDGTCPVRTKQANKKMRDKKKNYKQGGYLFCHFACLLVFGQLGQHNNHFNALIPHHAPEIIDSVLHRPLGGHIIVQNAELGGLQTSMKETSTRTESAAQTVSRGQAHTKLECGWR